MTGPTLSESIAAAPLAGRLPTMAPGDAALSRLAHDARFTAWLRSTLGHATVTVAAAAVRQEADQATDQVANPAADPAAGSDPDTPMPWRITVETAHGRFSLRLDAAASPALQLALAHRPRDTACAVVTLLLAGWAEAFASALGPMRVVDIAPENHGDARPVVLGGSTPVTLLDADAGLLERLAAVIARAGIDLSPLARLPLRPSIRLFSRALPRGVLRALQPGDVVLAGEQAPLLRCGVGRAWRARLHIDPQEFTVHLAEPPMISDDPAAADAMPDAAGSDAPLAAAGSLDELQLPVAFELDTARIGLADLASMQPGYAVELDVPLREATVRLVCHGRLLGQGQLIAIGDQLGVRITRLEFAHDAAAAR
ncbi:FliM/FliN family flagellar motor switch protein [Mitsuaria sp. GD03876]|uniref:FliM/FliN family flagellar motor switch protein n=1 Tax=Mitsuaria sp. GD03876 TaxID=2975399 RepID=UPI00244A7DC6|nr:FliM/FliN family flagellar motor switch protein [Mitsuaria sp. GD03876]MDH0866039.1 FliM/FliN family flagellar motor switch protein [Mitsuaria sp. GD03876]